MTSKSIIKSLASSLISSNTGSSKSHSPDVTLVRVSESLSPAKGERPDSKTYVITPRQNKTKSLGY